MTCETLAIHGFPIPAIGAADFMLAKDGMFGVLRGVCLLAVVSEAALRGGKSP